VVLAYVREGWVPKIVEEASQAQELSLSRNMFWSVPSLCLRQALARQSVEYATPEPHDAERMREPPVLGARIDIAGKSQLPNMPQTLEGRAVDELGLEARNVNEVVNRISEPPIRLRLYHCSSPPGNLAPQVCHLPSGMSNRFLHQVGPLLCSEDRALMAKPPRHGPAASPRSASGRGGG
jgi:hypothetical protein